MLTSDLARFEAAFKKGLSIIGLLSGDVLIESMGEL